MDLDATIAVLQTHPALAVLAANERPPAALIHAVDVLFAGADEPNAIDGGDDPLSAAVRFSEQVDASPRPATTLAWLLRASEALDVRSALAMESASYSMLLASADFQSWQARRGLPRAPDGPDRVRLRRDANTLGVTLTRPARRNAVDTRMRHELLEALTVATAAPDLHVEVDAEGPGFCAGGDLDEFGTARDPADAHLVRVGGAVGQRIHELRKRISFAVHGACVGAGIEMAAFAGHVTATPDAYFALPEIELGLIPGAGGTVSIPRRIGRQRTLWLAVTGNRLDARIALAWGLIDAIC